MNNANPPKVTIKSTTVHPLEDINIVDAVNFINNAITLSPCRLECRADKHDHIFSSDFISIKNCTILCTPPQALPQKIIDAPEGGYFFNANNVTDNLNNVQGSNFNFSYNASERKNKKPSVVVDDERYIASAHGVN